MLNGRILYEQANKNPNEFYASLKLRRDPKIEQLTIDNLLLRGSILKNISWIFGMVVHAGHDTKLYQNLKYKKHNISFVEKCSESIFKYKWKSKKNPQSQI